MSDSVSTEACRRRAALTAAVAAGIAVGLPLVAAAQGNGHGHAYGHHKPRGSVSSGPSAAGAPELHVPGTGIRTFGSWLDDASVMAPGQGSASVAFTYWRTPAYREFDVPVMDAGFGITRRVQFNFSVPYYHASEPGGPVARGLGDLNLSAKIQLRDPSAKGRHVGFSVTPLVELRSHASPESSRASWALPGSIEFQGRRWRAFGTAGYFSRGALFASGALQAAVSDRMAVSGSITRSHSVRRDDLSVALGLAQSRTDVSGSVSVGLTPAMSAFAALGRTISRRDPNSATLTISSGVAVSFQAWR
jgi:hypothetical protein